MRQDAKQRVIKGKQCQRIMPFVWLCHGKSDYHIAGGTFTRPYGIACRSQLKKQMQP